VFPVRYGLNLYILHKEDPRVGQQDFQSHETVKYGPAGLGSKNRITVLARASSNLPAGNSK
jgi:hypothetical protein